jgi:peptidoglycan/LPS O-acetylase OafA/YrhL
MLLSLSIADGIRQSMNLKYLEGLNGLRFLAALLVVIRHICESSEKIGIWNQITSTVLFERGLAAVDFFFTMSGFLITYLLIQEYAATSQVSLKNFYLRRACRIWPLYFIILGIGFIFFTLIFPRLFHQVYFDFSPLRGLLFYVAFLPHWMASQHRVGFLVPMWSIGVEEQFYLFWAPMVKFFARWMPWLMVSFIAITAGFQLLLQAGWLVPYGTVFDFLHMLRFHYMAVGSLFAWILFYHGQRYSRSVFAQRWFQALNILFLAYHYLIGFPLKWGVFLDLPLALSYGLLVLGVSVAPNRLLNLEWEPLIYLGKISYGIYMYHMVADYAVRQTFISLHLDGVHSFFRMLVYGALVIGITLVISHLSYRYVESYFLSLGRHRPRKLQVSAA